MKQVHFIRKGRISSINKLEEELEVQQNEKISIKMEVSVEKSLLQQHKSKALDGDAGDLTLKVSAMDKALKCPHCDKKCHHEIALSRHVKSTHVPTSCEICGIAFNNKHQLGYHKVYS